MTKLILFDLGDVLTDYSKRFITLSKETNIPKDQLLEIFSQYRKELVTGETTLNEIFKDVIDESIDILDLVAKDYITIQPTYSLVKSLESKYRVGLLSNIYKGIVPLFIEKDIIPQIEYSYFFLSCEIGERKPDMGIYEHIMNVVDIKPEEILFIDDKEKNLEIPKKMGWSTFHFNNGDIVGSVKEIQEILG